MSFLTASEYLKASLMYIEANSELEAFEKITKTLCKQFEADYGSVILKRGSYLHRVFATSPLILKSPVKKYGRTYRVFNSQKPLVSYIKTYDDLHPEQHTLGIKTVLFIPLVYKKNNLGVLNLLSRKELSFSQEDIKILKNLGNHLALVILQAKKIEALQKKYDNQNLFLSYASHEVKTPLTTISLYLELLDRHLQKKDKDVHNMLTILKAETRRIRALINELLVKDHTRIQDLKFNCQSVSLNEVVWRAKLDFMATRQEHILHVKNTLIQGEDIIYGDFDKLLQVLLNILTNAAKFSPPGSTILLQVRDKKDRIAITIKDQGQGIPKKEIPYIFEKFYRVKDTKEKGMGLGLFLTKKIIEHHKGEIQVSSTIGKGTTFTIIVPKQEIHESEGKK